jgi:hypothetical protein
VMGLDPVRAGADERRQRVRAHETVQRLDAFLPKGRRLLHAGRLQNCVGWVLVT